MSINDFVNIKINLTCDITVTLLIYTFSMGIPISKTEKGVII